MCGNMPKGGEMNWIVQVMLPYHERYVKEETFFESPDFERLRHQTHFGAIQNDICQTARAEVAPCARESPGQEIGDP
jgi:hypothetical protein